MTIHTFSAQPVLRSAYKPPVWTVTHTRLSFDIFSCEKVVVHGTLHFKSTSSSAEIPPLCLDAERLNLSEVSLDGVFLSEDQYQHDEHSLTLYPKSPEGTFSCSVTLVPSSNTLLEGLYASDRMICTQCEAEGFRRIFPSLDRPDVLSVYEVRIRAPKNLFPYLLSNGNTIEQHDLEEEWHSAVWRDPFPKPTYLFALVAGHFDVLEDRFTTMEGREVRLRLFTDPGEGPYGTTALSCLKKAMRWDEQRFGRAYDLDDYMIVAVRAFNMGAMENKGLNVFNSRYVLASKDTATDADYEGIDSVIAHEYLHNWTGNRVTCRDWFQLSLKEGLTIFRDQEYTMDHHPRLLKRLEDIRLLRSSQFKEDAGPLAHPVRPESYLEINNFYTLTIYEKGAEIIRMLHTLLGEAGFRRGMDLYFERHDGQAVTIDDFLSAMADANARDLSAFQQWYSQAGTPEISIEESFDQGTYRLTLTQSDPLAAQQGWAPRTWPLCCSIALFDRSGKKLLEELHWTTEGSVEYEWKHFETRPVASVFRNFSSPVRMHHPRPLEDHLLLLEHETDGFARFESIQELWKHFIDAEQKGQVDTPSEHAFFKTLVRLVREEESAFAALCLSPPDLDTLALNLPTYDPVALWRSIQNVLYRLAVFAPEDWHACETSLNNGPYEWSAEQSARRSLRATLWSLLLRCDLERYAPQVFICFEHADNMTDRQNALSLLSRKDTPFRKKALDAFFDQGQQHALVLDRWFAYAGMREDTNAFEEVMALVEHPQFDWSNPNRVRSVFGSFAHRNILGFHGSSGRAYQMLADAVIRLDASNPRLAARLIEPLVEWKSLAEPYRSKMYSALLAVRQAGVQATDLREVLEKSL